MYFSDKIEWELTCVYFMMNVDSCLPK